MDLSLIAGGRIFWTDARTDKIESSNLDGSNRRTIYEEPLSNIVGLSYFRGYLYYTDWHKEYELSYIWVKYSADGTRNTFLTFPRKQGPVVQS